MARYRSHKPQANNLTGIPSSVTDYLAKGAPQGQRNPALFAAAGQCRDADILPQMRDALINRAISDGLGMGEILQCLHSAETGAKRASALERTVQRPAPNVIPATFTKLGFEEFLAAAFREGEIVSIAPTAENEDGERKPTAGVTFTREEWLEKVRSRGGIDKVFSTKHGLFVRVNPVTKGGSKNADVTAFRHVLVEFDKDAAGATIPKEKQRKAIEESRFPVTVLIDSGNKSLHAWVRVDAKNAEEYKQRVQIVWDHFATHNLDTQNRNAARLSRCPDGWRTIGDTHPTPTQQRLLAVDIGAADWAAWQAGDGSALPAIVAGDAYMSEPYPEPPILLAGVLHQGCKMILGGASKSRKSWALMDLALCVLHGLPWWGIETIKGRVLYVNFELPNFAFQSRLKMILASRNLAPDTVFDVWTLRGHNAGFDLLLPKMIERIKDHHYSMIILDPIYKGLGGRDENNAGDIAELCNEIESLASKSGAAVVFGAHFSKGTQTAKNSVDRIGGSGVFARDPDAIVTMTPHEEDNAYTIDFTLRTFAPHKPIVVQLRDAIFEPIEADPSKLEGVEKPKESRFSKRPASASHRLKRRSEDAAKDAAKEDFNKLRSMPPLVHASVDSPVVAHIATTLGYTPEMAAAIFSRMSDNEATSPIRYDAKTGRWRGLDVEP